VFWRLYSTFSTAPQTGDALVRGRQETGYPFVGYIVSDQNHVCAGTMLDRTTIITAGHCLATGSGNGFRFGLGDFSVNGPNQIRIVSAKFPSNFNINNNQGPDLAIAKLEYAIDLHSYATLGVVEENCDTSIVAYGAGVSGAAASDMFMKKAGEGCTRDISKNFLIDFDGSVGMCFGDSGGPFFKNRGSSEVVGILSGGLIDPYLDELRCDPGNTGYVVNVSSYFDFLSDWTVNAGYPNTRLLAESAAFDFQVPNLPNTTNANQPEIVQTFSNFIDTTDIPIGIVAIGIGVLILTFLLLKNLFV